MADIGDDSIPLDTFYDAPTSIVPEDPPFPTNLPSEGADRDHDNLQPTVVAQPSEETQAQNISAITTWLERLCTKLGLLSALEKGLIMVLSVLMVWLAWITFIQSKRQGSFDEWSSKATFREDCRRERERTGSMSVECNRSLSIPLAPPSPRSLTLFLFNMTSNSLPNVSISRPQTGISTSQRAYYFLSALLGLALAVYLKSLHTRLRPPSVTNQAWVPDHVPRHCAPFILLDTTRTISEIDKLVDILAGDLVEQGLASTKLVLPLARFICDLKDDILNESRKDGDAEYARISQSLRRTHMVKFGSPTIHAKLEDAKLDLDAERPDLLPSLVRSSGSASPINDAVPLRKIPGPESYSYHSSDSVRQEGTADTPQDSFLQTTSSPKLFAGGLAEDKSLVGQRGSVGADALLVALPQLKELSRTRQRLLHLESKAQKDYMNLAIQREALLIEIKEKSDTILGIDDGDMSRFRELLQRHLSRLRKLATDLITLERDLRPLQERLLQAQYKISETNDNLYAILAGGPRLWDSIASLEDQFLEALAATFSRPKDLESEEDEKYTSHYARLKRNRCVGSIEENSTRVAAKTTIHRSEHQIVSRPVSDVTKPRVHRGSPDIGHVSDSNQPSSTAPFQIPDSSLISHCGHQFLQEDLQSYRHAATGNRLLSPDPSHLVIRRTDLRTLLGYDVLLIDPSLNWTGEFEKEVSVGVSQKLTNINMPTIHKRQLISLWGRNMSQNTALDATRVVTYGRIPMRDLIRLGDTDPLEKLIKDMRRLELPLNEDVPQPPFIPLDDNN